MGSRGTELREGSTYERQEEARVSRKVDLGRKGRDEDTRHTEKAGNEADV